MIIAASLGLPRTTYESATVFPQPLILMDAMMGVAGFTNQLQYQPQPQMPVVTLAHATYAMGPLQVSSLSKLSLPLVFCVGVMGFSSLSDLIWLQFTPVGTQLLGFAPL